MTTRSDDQGRSDLAAIDEILEVIFWMQGEGLAAAVSASDLLRFVATPREDIDRILDRLTRRGWLRNVAASREPRYELTDVGRREAGRRFADEFADMTKPGHGECGDPECECHRTGSPADCTHRSPEGSRSN